MQQTSTKSLKIKAISSLEKCLVNETIEAHPALRCASMFSNERYSFQIAFQMEPERSDKLMFGVRIESQLNDSVNMYRELQMPSETPVMDGEHDDYILQSEPGLFPDCLVPLREGEMLQLGNHRLCALWVDIEPEGRHFGSNEIRVIFSDTDGNEIGNVSLTINISELALPKQKLIHTEWFYCDCLKTYYGTETFDERHFKIISNFMKTAAGHGMNMILTPLFTYALDTAVGSERPTTQLVDVTVDPCGNYSFGFGLLERFVRMAQDAGFEYFEMCHFFTQWGARSVPKVIASTPEGKKRIFGWDTASDDERYRMFLRALIPGLRAEFEKLGILDRVYWHVSDEPNEKSFDTYKPCYDLMAELVGEDRIIDAMSNYSFYEKGVLKRPVPGTGSVARFAENGVGNLWTYYCCDQRLELSNRYYAMPSARTRALGVQLYKYGIRGFLHWGYNFYFSQYSLHPVNPFIQTDCDGFAESGDAFLVYPAPDGSAFESIRLKTMAEVMQDVRACEMLESLKGRAYVEALIAENLGELTFYKYPHNAEAYIDFREKINSEIERYARSTVLR